MGIKSSCDKRKETGEGLNGRVEIRNLGSEGHSRTNWDLGRRRRKKQGARKEIVPSVKRGLNRALLPPCELQPLLTKRHTISLYSQTTVFMRSLPGKCKGCLKWPCTKVIRTFNRMTTLPGTSSYQPVTPPSFLLVSCSPISNFLLPVVPCSNKLCVSVVFFLLRIHGTDLKGRNTHSKRKEKAGNLLRTLSWKSRFFSSVQLLFNHFGGILANVMQA